MARTRRRLTAPTAQAEFLPVLEKARAITGRMEQLKRSYAGAHRLAHLAQTQEALTRAELSLALTESLAARAELAARLRAISLKAYQALAKPRRLRRHNRLSRLLDKGLARLGKVGAVIIALRSGLLFGTSLFDAAAYRSANPDVAASRVSPLAHYLVTGGREGRAPHPLLDEGHYRAENAEALAATGLTSLEHYQRAGAAQGLSPHPLFDVGHYLAQSVTLAPGEDPLSHYLRQGWRERASPHPLFDVAWYARQAPEPLTQAPLTLAPLLHYLTLGWREGRSPHPLFDPTWYLDQDPGLAAAAVEPLTHFLTTGVREGRNPSPWFDLAHYVAARGDGMSADANPLVDYLQGGAWAVGEAYPGLPTPAYLAARPGLARRGVTPLEHWARRRGR